MEEKLSPCNPLTENVSIPINNNQASFDNRGDSKAENRGTGEDFVSNPINDGIARERFIRFLLAMDKKKISINLYENTKVSGVFEGADVGFQNIAVSQLKTPIAIYDYATIRTSDCMTITVDLIGEK